MPRSNISVRSRPTSPVSKPPTLVARIQTHWAALPSSEQRIAEFLLNAPSTLVSHNAGEMADLANTSKAAVTRLIQRLGYATFTEARQQARAAQDWGSPLYIDIEQEPAERSLKAKLAQQFRLEQSNMEQTWNAQTETVLQQSVDRISQAGQVVLIGFRNSAVLATYMAAQLGLLRSRVTMPEPTNDWLTSALYELGPGDLAIVVAFRRRVSMLPKILKVLRQQKTPVLLITDSSGLGLADPSDLVITCKCQSSGLFDSYAAPTSMLNFLLAQVSVALGESARARLRDIEGLHSGLKDLI